MVLFIILIVLLANESLLLASAHFCATKTSCGNGSVIPPPFWIDDGSLGEGCTNYPSFRIKCARDGTPTMNISNGLYTVLRVETYDDGAPIGLREGWITVREAAINEQGCPQPQQKLPIGYARFLTVAAEEVNIFYNCSRAPPNIKVQEIPCLQKYDNNSSKHSYALRNNQLPASLDWFSHCENSALTYIDYDDDQRHSSNFVEELHKGFTLQWSTPVDCTDCVNSGGRCSSNETTGEIACYCPHDGAYPRIDYICSDYHSHYVDLSIKRRIRIVLVIFFHLLSRSFYYRKKKTLM